MMLNTLKDFVSDEAPAILAGLGITGFVTSTVMAVLATPEAINRLDILEEEADDGLTTKEYRWEQAKRIFPVYAPTIGLTLVSVAMIVGSARVTNYRYAALYSLYMANAKSLDRWKAAAEKRMSGPKFEETRLEATEPSEDTDIPTDLVRKDKHLVWESFSGRYFSTTSIEEVRRVVNDLNDRLLYENFVPLNDYYWDLKLAPTATGNMIGWDANDGVIGLNIDSKVVEYEGEKIPIFVVSFDKSPRGYVGEP